MQEKQRTRHNQAIYTFYPGVGTNAREEVEQKKFNPKTFLIVVVIFRIAFCCFSCFEQLSVQFSQNYPEVIFGIVFRGKEIIAGLGSAHFFYKTNFPALFSRMLNMEKSAEDFDI